MFKKQLTAEEKHMITQHQLERELISLKKEWAVLERCRSNPNYGSYLKYTKVTNSFNKEHSNILKDLVRATDPGRQREDWKNFEILYQQMNCYDRLTAGVNTYKEYIAEVENEIKRVKKSVQQLQKEQVTDRQYEDRIRHAMKTIEALENKLEVQTIKFGTICAKNRQLREELDHLLWDRRNFLSHWHRFIDRMTEGKQIMLDLIEQATIAYNQREEWCNKLQALRIKAHQDFTVNIQEMRDLIRKHDNNFKIQEFLLIKSQKRYMRDLEKKVKQKRLEQQAELQEKLDNYRNMLREIKTFTKEHEIEDIATKFMVQDEYNLSNFKYIIDLMREMEFVADDLGMYHLDIEEKNVLHSARSVQQEETLGKLEQEKENITEETKAVSERLEDTQNFLDNLLKGVWSLFKICKCDQDPLFKLLGDNATVQVYNVFFYIDILESKIQELLVYANYKDKSVSERRRNISKQLIQLEEEKPVIHAIEKVIKASPCSLCVEHEMVTDVIDVLQVPLSREQVKAKLNRRLNLPGGYARIHNISDCQLPQSRGIMQKRYQ